MADLSDNWKNGLFSLDDKFGICLKTYLFPHCVLAQARSDYDGSNCCFNCLVLGSNPHAVRTLVRHGYGIDGSCLTDVIASACCFMCTIAQVAKEVELRGPIQSLTGTASAQSPWSTDLISIDGDCIYACFLPHCAAASARTEFDGSNWCYNCLCVHPLLHLSVVRHGYNIAGGCCSDVLGFHFCAPCVIGRMKKETGKRGLCVSKGSGGPGAAQMN